MVTFHKGPDTAHYGGMDAEAVSPSMAALTFFAHMAVAMRNASSLADGERVKTDRYRRAREISERITRRRETPVPAAEGDQVLTQQALADLHQMADCCANAHWLASADQDELRRAVEHHRRLLANLIRHLGAERCNRYRLDPRFCQRCLDAVLADGGGQ